MGHWDIGYLFRESCYEKMKEVSFDDKIVVRTYEAVDAVISPVKSMIEETAFENYK